MAQNGDSRRLREHFDAVDVWTMALTAARYAAFVSWADVIVRAIRGEEAKENWKTSSSTAALMALSALQSASEIREFASLRGAAVEMRQLVDDATTQAELRDRRADERERHGLKQQELMLRLTKWLVAFALLTLAAAIVTVAR